MFDNIDVLLNVYGGISSFFIVDFKVSYCIDKYVMLVLGVDNLIDWWYFVYYLYLLCIFYG